MPSKTLLAAAAILIVVIAIGSGYVGWTFITNNKPTATPTPEITPTPQPPTPAQAREAAMSYIASSHAETAQLMSGFTWTGGKQNNTGQVSIETYLYASGGWTVQAERPVVSNGALTILANYSQGDESVTWRGTYQNYAIVETSYSSENLQPVASTVTQARDDVMLFIANRHSDAASLLTTLSWTGGRITPAGVVGFETYNFTDAQSGWNVLVQYPVVPNPALQVNATYTSPTSHLTFVVWQGTWQSGAITETSYKFGT